ncbi:hippocampus abundant transcript 1 protein-like isoform X2 [Clavelina lepadiformis]|uniref:hippocampus abundant transcript 1 protein-like isoform X2 n=1 Tax=Clavelina lepadiformis TaxID=159417 RepID=UPI0040422743
MMKGMGKASVYHAVVILFLEFFAFGLMTIPMLELLERTFKDQMFLINGLVQGIKGFLSFLSAPLLGALSDVWGRKSFLLLTVFVTCAPIPLMLVSPWWFFAMLSLSGTCSVTFSIVFAYVADITDETNRSSAYGLVSATFAASLVTSPAIGHYLGRAYGETAVVMLATAIASFDICFILLSVPESLPEQVRPKTWGAPISWDQADPFASLRKVGQDKTLLLLCLTVFLSYLPEAGQYSFVFLYLQQVIGFTKDKVVSYIAVVGISSILTQTALLGMLFQLVGNKNVILLGLTFQIGQLLFFSFGKHEWIMWAAGILAALSSINYPAMSSFVSNISSKDQQGVVQGIVTGIRGLCNGLGPALFGLIFQIFHVELNSIPMSPNGDDVPMKNNMSLSPKYTLDEKQNHYHDQACRLLTILPGPPYLFGTFTVILAMLIAWFLPKHWQNMYRQVPNKDIEQENHISLIARTQHQKKALESGKMSDAEDQSINEQHCESTI